MRRSYAPGSLSNGFTPYSPRVTALSGYLYLSPQGKLSNAVLIVKLTSLSSHPIIAAYTG